MKISRTFGFFVAAIICLVAFAGVNTVRVSAQNGFPLPNFELPYYANTGPTWTGGPHQWAVGPSTKWMSLNSGSGLDFAYGGQTFAVAAMAEGDVIWARTDDQGGGLGIKVAVKHTVGGSIVIYGHLSSIWTPILNAMAANQTYHVLPGYTIGQAGKTGTDNIHLHVELRDGSRDCCSAQGDGGIAISWHSKMLNGYRIYEYRPNELGIICNPPNSTSNCKQFAYNYDGVAVKEDGVHADWFPTAFENFSFKDYTNEMRTSVYTWLPSNFVCNGAQSNCELSTPRADVQFAGHGKLGGGGKLASDLTVPANQPQPGSGSSPTATPLPITGNSRVDIFESTNYSGEQYGWDDPTNGWVNGPGSLNDKVSSVQIDSGYSLWVAKDQNGGGTRKCLVSSYTDLSGAYYDDTSPMTDTISSVNVFHDSTCGGAYLGTRPGDTVTFWENANFEWNNWGVHDPYSGSLMANMISSIGLTPGWSAVVYDGANLTNGFTCFTASDPDLTNNTFNSGYPVADSIESGEIFHDINCGGRMHAPTVNLVSAAVTNQSNGEVTITYNVSGAAPGYSIHTSFGDGSNDFDILGPTVNTTATHNYAYGNYTIIVSIKGTDGLSYPYTIPITVSAPATATPTVPVYSLTIDNANTASGLVNFTLDWSNALADWHHIDFGDGQSFDVNGASGHQSASHVYNPGQNPYTLSFTVKGQNNQNYVASQQVSMPLPTVSLTINSVDSVTGFTMFTAAWTNAPIDSWQRITFGQEDFYVDYQGASDTKVDSHIYPPGTYTMTLTVNCRNGQTYTASQQVVVTGPTATPVPQPTLSLTILSVDNATGVVSFQAVWNNALNDWQHMDFGHDGAYVDYQGGSGDHTDSNIIPVGTYTFTLTVKGMDGQTYTASQQVTRS